MDERISISPLSNGLTVIIEEIPEVQSAAYELLIPGGIICDPEDRIGASLILGELMVRGAGSLSSVALSDAFDDIGVVHSESAGHDRYSLRGSLLSEHLDQALRLVSLMVQDPHLPEGELDSIRSILEQEILALPDHPSRRVLVELTKRYYPGVYGRPTVGTIEGMERCSVEDLRADWSRQFHPRGAVLSIAGRVSREEVLASVDRAFGSWGGECVELPAFGQLPVHSHHHIDTDSAQLQIALAYPSVRFGEEHYYTAKVVNGLLSGGMFGRLFIEVREKRGLCYSVFSRHSAAKEYGTVLVYAGTTPERAHETLEVIVQELRGLRGTVTADELSRARANIKATLVIGEESSGSRCASHASDWWVAKRVRSSEEIQQGLDGVTIEGINEYLDAYPSTSYMLVTLGSRPILGAERAPEEVI